MATKTAVFRVHDEEFEVKTPITPWSLQSRINGEIDDENPILGASYNNRMISMREPLSESGRVDFIRYRDRYGKHYYRRGMTLVLGLAVQRVLIEDRLHIGHSIENGYYYQLANRSSVPKHLLEDLSEEMEHIIRQDLPIEIESVSRDEALEIFRRRGQSDKIKLIELLDQEEIQLQRVDDYVDSAYFPAPASTGQLKTFELHSYVPGFILRFPEADDPTTIPPAEDQPKLFQIYQESKKWGQILEINNVGDLNEIIENKNISEFIKIHEAFHSKNISEIADEIAERLEGINVVCIAGPSSSGKTTFSKRLGIQLRINGVRPVKISTDDYFVDRENTPRDEQGNYDFEAVEAIDLELLNAHLEDLLNGKRIEVPKFSFEEGNRKEKTTPLELTGDQIVIIEGIHGLNPRLTEAIPRHRKYMIYVSALTQLVIDDHNRISTSDSRLIRRIVRDILFRDIPPETNIERWPSVRRGETEYIFPHQESADVMFNSALLYELSALRPYILPALEQVSPDTRAHRTAQRIRNFINLFKTINHREIPPTSILREFIGGSSFNY